MGSIFKNITVRPLVAQTQNINFLQNDLNTRADIIDIRYSAVRRKWGVGGYKQSSFKNTVFSQGPFTKHKTAIFSKRAPEIKLRRWCLRKITALPLAVQTPT
jgi:hypothetical protein